MRSALWSSSICLETPDLQEPQEEVQTAENKKLRSKSWMGGHFSAALKKEIKKGPEKKAKRTAAHENT